jgi:CSLREA domain-containing protein
MMGRRGVIGRVSVCAAALTLLMAGQAGAANINVETTADVTVADTECSLREAMASANANSGGGSGCEDGAASQDFIKLPAGTYTLLGAPGDDANLSGDLDYTGGGAIVIQGPFLTIGPPQATIDAPPSDRIIDVPIAASPRQVFVESVTLTDGRALGVADEGDGGAIRIADTDVDLGINNVRITGSQAGRNGGAVSFDSADVFGNLDVVNAEFSGNSAGTQVAGGSGGAFWSGVDQNDPIVKNSTLAGNSADGVGGGFALKASATIKFRNSTLSGNSSESGGNAVAYFGTGGNPSSFFEFSTIADNTSPFAHGAIEALGAGQAFFLRGTILSGNTGAGVPSNCAGLGQFNTQGYNVESANTCALVPATPDLINTDPLLAPLAISTVAGAQQMTRTHGLYDESPAADFIPRTLLDKCDASFTEDQDQRFVPRPAAPGGLCDAGAFEGTVGPKPVPPTINPPPAPPAKTPPAKKKCKKGRKLKKGKCVKKRKKRR